MIIVNIKKEKVIRNVIAAIYHNEYKDVLLNKKKGLRHSMNWIQSKDLFVLL